MTAVAHPGDALTRAERLTYILVLGALTALGPFTIDLYLPALPTLERELDAPTALVQLTLTATMVGFALGQLFVGPLSDQIGRRSPLLVATGVHILACLGAALAPDLLWLGIARIFQGVGAAAGGVVAMAMVRDLFGGYPLVRMLSRLALVSGLAPVIAPVIGSQLLLAVDWRGLFVFLAALGCLVLVANAIFLRETLPEAARHVRGHSTVGQRYGALFRDRIYVGAVIIAGANFSALFAYLSSSSFLFQDVYSLSPQEYGLLFGVNSLAVIAGVQGSSRLQKNVGPQWIVAGATVLQLVSAATIVVLDLSGAGFFGIAVPLWFFILGCGFNFPAISALALVRHGHEAGTAASVLGAANFGVAGIVSPIVGLFTIQNAVPMAGVMVVAVLVAIVALWTVVRPRTVPPLEA
ncbi:multidrug effflux MFS transporter [Protaetiibacter intestinalis]|uniref:Bcr/CflA family efflux MFS transporter n=1 Tax=Protaetiibacter intestinalis TaxID=2419774 RepID=A0A387BAP5_9MICO|nr:multidrug effflux MFS transporter [Protaetiibacter intestinalis]AYF98206.1 Bcr/CflA family efflux MFS transporter [Protaetiibacter intestinalis]